tara:strand:+ start:141 stop:548 length:408 start_codon:yes stop_codon:yes gene_type:complete
MKRVSTNLDTLDALLMKKRAEHDSEKSVANTIRTMLKACWFVEVHAENDEYRRHRIPVLMLIDWYEKANETYRLMKQPEASWSEICDQRATWIMSQIISYTSIQNPVMVNGRHERASLPDLILGDFILWGVISHL